MRPKLLYTRFSPGIYRIAAVLLVMCFGVGSGQMLGRHWQRSQQEEEHWSILLDNMMRTDISTFSMNSALYVDPDDRDAINYLLKFLTLRSKEDVFIDECKLYDGFRFLAKTKARIRAQSIDRVFEPWNPSWKTTNGNRLSVGLPSPFITAENPEWFFSVSGRFFCSIRDNVDHRTPDAIVVVVDEKEESTFLDCEIVFIFAPNADIRLRFEKLESKASLLE